LVRRSAILDGTTEEALELPQVGIARVRERHTGWADASTHHFAHTFQNSGEPKLGVLPEVMARMADKGYLD
jgi:hypothetical protein